MAGGRATRRRRPSRSPTCPGAAPISNSCNRRICLVVLASVPHRQNTEQLAGKLVSDHPLPAPASMKEWQERMLLYSRSLGYCHSKQREWHCGSGLGPPRRRPVHHGRREGERAQQRKEPPVPTRCGVDAGGGHPPLAGEGQELLSFRLSAAGVFFFFFLDMNIY